MTEQQQTRLVRFHTLDDIKADVLSFEAEPVNAGNWTAGEVLDHVRRGMTPAREGYGGFSVPLPMRLFGRYLAKPMIFKKGMPKGVKIPPAAQEVFIPTPGIPWEQARDELCAEIDKCKEPGAIKHSNPFFGPLSDEEFVKLHCRHAEHHFAMLRAE